ncbi:MAG: adenylate kinase family protein [Promethearchaeota archaeon]
MTKLKHYVVFGAPGSGKGTFCQRLTRIFPELKHISTGDIFRENITNKTELGLKVKEILQQGLLVSDDLTNELVKNHLKELSNDSWILDGYPRNINQAIFLDNITDIDKVIILEVEPEVLIKRILGRYACQNCGYTYNKFFEATQPKKEGVCDNCGADLKFEQRADDNEETIKTRLQAYETNAKPIIDYYEKQGIVKRVDSTKTLEFSHEEILEIIN